MNQGGWVSLWTAGVDCRVDRAGWTAGLDRPVDRARWTGRVDWGGVRETVRQVANMGHESRRSEEAVIPGPHGWC